MKLSKQEDPTNTRDDLKADNEQYFSLFLFHAKGKRTKSR